MAAAVGIDVQPGRKRPAVTVAAGVQVNAGSSSLQPRAPEPGMRATSWPATNPSLRACASPAQSIVRAYGGLRDDTSLVVVDILPPGKTFPECAASVAAAAKAASGGSGHGGAAAGAAAGAMCGCFGSAPSAPPAPIAAAAAAEEPAAALPPAAVGRLEVLADLDVAAVMGLMPETESTTPGWYDEYVGEALFSLAVSLAGGCAGECCGCRAVLCVVVVQLASCKEWRRGCRS